MTSSNQVQKFVYYYHPDDLSMRILGTDDAIPHWAVNVEYDDGILKNSVGLPVHPTDKYVHWKDKEPGKKMKELREAYDAIEASGHLKFLQLLLDEAYSTGRVDEYESNCPDI